MSVAAAAATELTRLVAPLNQLFVILLVPLASLRPQISHTKAGRTSYLVTQNSTSPSELDQFRVVDFARAIDVELAENLPRALISIS